MFLPVERIHFTHLSDFVEEENYVFRNKIEGELLSASSTQTHTGFSFFQAAIRKELNEFKSTEMEVHELSRHLTRLVSRGFFFLLSPFKLYLPLN